MARYARRLGIPVVLAALLVLGSLAVLRLQAASKPTVEMDRSDGEPTAEDELDSSVAVGEAGLAERAERDVVPGACCLPDGSCSTMTLSQCIGQGGLHLGPDSECRGDADSNGINDACESGCTEATEKACNSSTSANNSVNSDVAYPPMTCAGGESIGVLWFSFTATHDSVQISTCNSLGTADDSVFALYSGDCTNTLTEIACAEDPQNCDPGPKWNGTLDTDGLIIGDTYYIQLASWSTGDQGTYDLDITCPSPLFLSAACCLSDGSCVAATPTQCDDLDGYYQDPDTQCEGDLDSNGINDACEWGACCRTDPAECVQSTQDWCFTGLDGVDWIWATPCSEAPCVGACCRESPPGTWVCTKEPEAICTNGDWYKDEECGGPGGEGPWFDCPAPGVCTLHPEQEGDNCHGPDGEFHGSGGFLAAVSDEDPWIAGGVLARRAADDFIPLASGIEMVCWWGHYEDMDSGAPPPAPECSIADDLFTITYYDDDNGCPGTVIEQYTEKGRTPTLTVVKTVASPPAGWRNASGHLVYEYKGTHAPLAVTTNGCSWIEIVNDTGSSSCAWAWETAPPGDCRSVHGGGAPGEESYTCPDDVLDFDLAWCLNVPVAPTDCSDFAGAQILAARSCKVHGPDPDCNSNGSCRLCIDLMDLPPGKEPVEPRKTGVTEVELDLDVDASSVTADDIGVTCAPDGPYSGAIGVTTEVTTNGSTLTLAFDPPLPDRNVCWISLACGDVVCVRTLEGDVNRNGGVNTTDLSQTKPRFGKCVCPPGDPNVADPEWDFDLSGEVNSNDYSQIKLYLGRTVRACETLYVAEADDIWVTRCPSSTSFDFLLTPISAGSFGTGSDPFEDVVPAGGRGGSEPDTVVRRGALEFEPGIPSVAETWVKLTELRLRSCDPITVTYDGGQGEEEEWDLEIDLCGQYGDQWEGLARFIRTDLGGGTVDVYFYVEPCFTFTKLSDPDESWQYPEGCTCGTEFDPIWMKASDLVWEFGGSGGGSGGPAGPPPIIIPPPDGGGDGFHCAGKQHKHGPSKATAVR